MTRINSVRLKDDIGVTLRRQLVCEGGKWVFAVFTWSDGHGAWRRHR